VLVASPAVAQNIGTGTVTIPAAGRPTQIHVRPARPRSAADAINYDTIHLEKRVTAVRAVGPIMLDGALDEAAWREAPVANGFIQNDPRRGIPPPTTPTSACSTRTMPCISASSRTTTSHTDRAQRFEKDYNKDGNDGFRILLDTFHDGRNGYEFMTNPAGAKWDSQIAGRSGQQRQLGRYLGRQNADY
jgi:hypothetical protein